MKVGGTNTSYLVAQHVLHARCFAIANARLKEARSHRHADRLTAHAGAGPFRVAGDDLERSEQQHQQALRVRG